MVERCPDKTEADGSIPSTLTMVFDRINTPEPKEEPKDIFEFLEREFKHDTFFVEDLIALDEEKKKLFKQFTNITNDKDKRIVSVGMSSTANSQPGRLEKFSFGVHFLRKNAINVTAFRIPSVSNPKLTKEIIIEIYKKKFPHLIDVLPDRIEKEEGLTKEEKAYYEKLKVKVAEVLKRQSYFILSNCPTSGKIVPILRKLLRLGFIEYVEGRPSMSLEDCTFTLPEDLKKDEVVP